MNGFLEKAPNMTGIALLHTNIAPNWLGIRASDSYKMLELFYTYVYNKFKLRDVIFIKAGFSIRNTKDIT